MRPQRTIGSSFCVEGAGLFTGRPARVEIKPLGVDRGIVFERDGVEAALSIDALSDEPVHRVFGSMPPRCTGIRVGDTTIWTIEHVCSALVGSGVDNALVRVDGTEIPISDGSALGFVEHIGRVGVEELGAPVREIRVRRRARVGNDDSWIEIEPSDASSYEYTIDYGDGSPVTPCTVSWDGDHGGYRSRIAPARTFCLESEALQMRGAGLFGHLTTRDMVVLGPDGPIDNELRDERECGLHKLLDLIGDLALIGPGVIRGRVRAHRSGHALAHEMARVVRDQISIE